MKSLAGLFAEISEKGGDLRRTRHLKGIPTSLSGVEQELMPWPGFLLLLHKHHGVALERYTRTGQFAGDTWHADEEEAKHQAEYEYGDHLGEWESIPEDTEDPKGFAIDSLK